MRVIRSIIIAVVIMSVLTFGVMWQQRYSRYADASPLSIASVTSDDDVQVEEGRYLTFRPINTEERLGVIVYPGAYLDIRGYAPILKRVAKAGYRVVVAPMPFDLAILAIDRAADIQAAYPEVLHWVVLGHSVGGTAAAAFAAGHPEAVDGVDRKSVV